MTGLLSREHNTLLTETNSTQLTNTVPKTSNGALHNSIAVVKLLQDLAVVSRLHGHNEATNKKRRPKWSKDRVFWPTSTVRRTNDAETS